MEEVALMVRYGLRPPAWRYATLGVLVLLALLAASCRPAQKKQPPNLTPVVWEAPSTLTYLDADFFLQSRYILSNSIHHRIEAFDTQTRQTTWSKRLHPECNAFYVASGDRYAFYWTHKACVSLDVPELIVLDPASGEVVARATDASLEMPPIVSMWSGIEADPDRNRIYALSGRAGIAVFDLDPDSLAPTFVREIVIEDVESVTTPTRGQLFHTLSLTHDPVTGDIFIGSASEPEYGNIPDLYRIDPDSGQIEWKVDVEYPDNGEDAIAGHYAGYVLTMTLANDVLIIQANQSVQAFDPATGERYWYRELRCNGSVPFGGTDSQLYVPETGRVYFGRSSESCFYSVAANPANPDLWTIDTGDYGFDASVQSGLPAYLNGVVYFFNGALWAVDGRSGEVLSRSEVLRGMAINESVFTDGSHIYLSTKATRPTEQLAVFAFEPVRR